MEKLSDDKIEELAYELEGELGAPFETRVTRRDYGYFLELTSSEHPLRAITYDGIAITYVGTFSDELGFTSEYDKALRYLKKHAKKRLDISQ